MVNEKREILRELVDVYDAQGQPLGITKRLEEVHRDGDWHRSFHCWIVNPSIEGGAMLLQWRGAWKRNWPSKADTSAAGHYGAGEGIEGGLRELREELGVEAEMRDLVDAGVRIAVQEDEAGVRNHEFQDVRFLVDDRGIADYTVSYPEVGGLIFLPINAGLRLLSGETNVEAGEGFMMSQREGHSDVEREWRTIALTRESFISSIDRFAFKAFIIADRILRGDKYLQI